MLGSMPSKFIHFTDTIESAKAIYESGYDLSMFGSTGKKHKADPGLVQWDPRGMYALQYFEGMERDAPRPWVLFEKSVDRAIMMTDKEYEPGACGKAKLSELYGGKTGQALQEALLRDGIDAIVSAGGEQVILDPGSATPVAYGPAKGEKASKSSRQRKFAQGIRLGFQHHHLDTHGDQHYWKLYAYDEDTPEWDVVGYIDYSEYQGKFYVDYVFTNLEFRRQGIGTAMMRELERKASEEGAEVVHGMQTQEGAALIKSLDEEKTWDEEA